MVKLDNMTLTVKMDRSIDPRVHYISPGGYELLFSNGETIAFDFCESCGTVDKNDKSIVRFYLRDLDTDSFPKAENLVESLLLSKVKEVVECYIYTGEESEGDKEINPVAITEMCFSIISEDDTTTVEVGEDILSAYKTA